MNMDIDEEWENFMTSGKGDDTSSDDEYDTYNEPAINELISADISSDLEAPKATDIYISTKTKIAYLTSKIDLKIFWDIPVVNYSTPQNGVIKKQMKFNSSTNEELEEIKSKITDEHYYEEYIISHIDNPSGRIKFKDIRKISIGISKKDIMSFRCKKKSAFYNCFVMIIRLKFENVFKEFHVKVFNTGKLELPGIRDDTTFDLILDEIINILQPLINEPLSYKANTNETVLINSNFNCGFFVNRDALSNILKYKYNIQTIYDPCSYPGIQCKFYYNPDTGIQLGSQITEEQKNLYKNIKKVSFMIFRTGSVLIVGKCDENVLTIIYDFLKNILVTEFKLICQKGLPKDPLTCDKKIKNIRKRNITIEVSN